MELRDIYNNKGYKTEVRKERSEKLEDGEYYLATEVWIINSRSEILIQQRSSNKDVLPNMWGLTTGCMVSGEGSEEGALREVNEEIGLSIEKDELNFIRRIFRENSIWDIYFVYKDVELSKLILQKEEVSNVKFVSIEEFNNMLLSGELFEYPEIYDMLSLIDDKVSEY
ncbi:MULTISPECIES: NUDIX hydrolase [Clostridium]|uniref:NUDIX hydrolase n=1 Tax=Clostridium beijerinckii TaxID=1520 RepID=A0A1S9NAF6_CLOBE|nr:MULTISPECIES: NUDIX domain-containing protein [Clostridium]MBN7576929.1 NUDIX domain-containing protein [Clostridium beijerinckii]MBN7581935.1 NUDIX domain-containing protein [Clostridium beijerinckii]MBN7586710.1 NUDIX domain-containing protein [Clostridium beijerinckii]MBO0522863.1 NUDIX domain-containing protein [Clostridium beijerinckii]MZK48834.1 NUDIX domain-containing protein [Clostridium beijerinckii]